MILLWAYSRCEPHGTVIVEKMEEGSLGAVSHNLLIMNQKLCIKDIQSCHNITDLLSHFCFVQINRLCSFMKSIGQLGWDRVNDQSHQAILVSQCWPTEEATCKIFTCSTAKAVFPSCSNISYVTWSTCHSSYQNKVRVGLSLLLLVIWGWWGHISLLLKEKLEWSHRIRTSFSWSFIWAPIYFGLS